MATELAKAYVQIIPTTKGIQNNISKEMNGVATDVGEESGEKMGGAMGGAMKVGLLAAAAAAGALIKGAIDQGAQLQQSLGGVETLFKDSADKVIQNASEAYKTAGLSANDYMQAVTGFSASLLQGVAGDTEKAADIADMALTDMSDNANKMGTSMESIQAAYQGFAKGQYQLLDNLKLGYGGTKTEMERLLADATKLSGVEYDISNLADVYNAIHVIQTELDITGTTAKEAATTISGSMSMAKAAFDDFLGQLVIGGDLQESMGKLMDSASTFLVDNLLPAVVRVLEALPAILSTALTDVLPATLDVIINQVLPALLNVVVELIKSISGALPTLVTTIAQLAKDAALVILDNIPVILSVIPDLIVAVVDALISFELEMMDAWSEILTSMDVQRIIETLLPLVPKILTSVVNAFVGGDNIQKFADAGVKLFTSIVTSLPSILMTINQSVPKLTTGIVRVLIQAVPQLVQTGVQLFTAIVKNLPQAFSQIKSSAQYQMQQAISTLTSSWMRSFKDIGYQIIQGLIAGIKGNGSGVVSALKNIASSALGGVKQMLGIHSPSTAFAYVGEMIDAGLAGGIEGDADMVDRAMDGIVAATTGSLAASVTATGSPSGSPMEQLVGLVANLSDRIDKIQVVLDTGAVVGGLTPGMDGELSDRTIMAGRGLALT